MPHDMPVISVLDSFHHAVNQMNSKIFFFLTFFLTVFLFNPVSRKHEKLTKYCLILGWTAVADYGLTLGWWIVLTGV